MSLRGRLERATGETVWWIHEREPQLWALAVLSYGVGDGVTTAVGLGFEETSEAGVVVEGILAGFGIPGFLAFKLAMLGLFYGAWRLLASPGRAAIPFVLAVVGVSVTVWNCMVISTAMFL